MFSIRGLCVFALLCVQCVQCQIKEEDAPCVSQDDQLLGKCVSSQRCLSAVNDIRTKKYPQICSFKGREPIICCTDCELVNDTSNVLVDLGGFNYFKTGQKANDKCFENLVSLSYPCQYKKGVIKYLNEKDKCYTYLRRQVPHAAIGGSNANRRQFPHMALLGYGDSLESAQWLCGGSVISDRFILTAAHCLHRSPWTVKYAALGILKRSDLPETWQRYTVKRTYVPPEYMPPKKYHDIALLELETKIKFNQDVLPACLNAGDEDESLGIAIGWGAIGPREPLADTLQLVSLKRFSDEDCAAAFEPTRNFRNGYDNKTQACYGDKFRIIDTCEGDSGGPLQVVSSYGACIFKIIGVTSFGRRCGVLGSSGMYTRVSAYIPWIESIVWP